jgi:general secretion pathway protein I
MRFASTGSPVASWWNASRRSGRAGKSGRAKRKSEAGARGFTLIEALAAIVILALALSALLSAHDTGLRGAAAMDDHLQARLLAQSLLAQWSVDRTLQASSRGQSGRFAWTVSARPYGAPVGAADQKVPWMLHELTVTIAWPPARQVQLRTLRLMSVR